MCLHSTLEGDLFMINSHASSVPMWYLGLDIVQLWHSTFVCLKSLWCLSIILSLKEMHTGGVSRSNTSVLCVFHLRGTAPQDSLQSSAEVNTGWRCICTLRISDHGVDRDNIAFFCSSDNFSVLYTYFVHKRTSHWNNTLCSAGWLHYNQMLQCAVTSHHITP